ncbi:hypothetical protein T12_1024 [Trichinella patagoniensis]|uniref:Uncharacterized protein n=1 Tax=Trichinella patagoniensis TaxID=990121 RepID=A0A0V0WCZ2_9BILA|nr:hypothetical protein T12_1024 [Trichinella patagoniensis]
MGDCQIAIVRAVVREKIVANLAVFMSLLVIVFMLD